MLDWITQQGSSPETIEKGSEIMRLVYRGVTLLDSYLFMNAPLSALPKQYGFDAAKGYFPHLFNRKENWTVIRQGLPDRRLVIK